MRSILQLPEGAQAFPWIDPQHLLAGEEIVRLNFPRDQAASNLSALTTQVALAVALPLQRGDLVKKIGFMSGTTAAGTPTNYWFALYSPAGALLSQSADQTNTAWAANTALELALATPQLVSTPGVYFATIMVKATTPPTLVGKSVHHANVAVGTGIGASPKVLAQTHGSSLTDTAPATIATPTTVATIPLCWARNA